MNEQNLKPMNTRSKNEARENGKIGGKKSGEVRRKRKTIREQLEFLMSLPIQDEVTKEKLEKMGIKSDNMDNQMLMNVSLYKQALKGNTKAIEIVRDTLGEKPVEKLEHSGNISNSLEVLESIQNQLEGSKNG